MLTITLKKKLSFVRKLFITNKALLGLTTGYSFSTFSKCGTGFLSHVIIGYKCKTLAPVGEVILQAHS